MITIHFKGKVKPIGRKSKYVAIYVYVEYGGKELQKYVGKEVEGYLVILD